MEKVNENKQKYWMIGGTAAAAIGIGLVGGFALLFKVSSPGEYLAVSGFGIRASKGISISRSAIVFPWQVVTKVPMQPKNYKFNLHCLSAQYLPFEIPVTFALSPFDPTSNIILKQDQALQHLSNEELFKHYVQSIHHMDAKDASDVIKGVIHGETRVLAATMSIDAINDNRQEFKDKVSSTIQLELLKYGLRVDNANIAELVESDRDGGMGYLKARERKKLSNAIQESEVDVAENQKMGDIGKKQREADTRQQIAKLEAETTEQELNAKQQIAKATANLHVVEEESRRRSQIALVETNAKIALEKEELQKAIEISRATKELESKRADSNTVTKVKGECLMIETTMARDALLLQAQGQRDALIMQAQGQKDAMILKAEGEAIALERTSIALKIEGENKASAVLANLNAEAQGKLQMLQAIASGEKDLLMARASGSMALSEALKNDPILIQKVLEIQNGVPQKLAEEAAKGLKGLEPKIWSLQGDDPATAISKLICGLTPMLDMYHAHLKK